MKAIHNEESPLLEVVFVVANLLKVKNESNSQRRFSSELAPLGCGKSTKSKE